MSMNDISRSGAVSVQRLVRGVGSVAVGLFLTVATTSSVDCQTNTGPDAPAVLAEAGGWRLAVTEPAPGGTSSVATVLCYEVTGTTREPVLALEITPMWPGGAPAAPTVRTDATVGRSSATADLSAAGEGTFDLRVQLVVDGSKADRPSLEIRGVTLRQGAPRRTCS
jgi:hypothetical protein